jgi:hypothetical protein
VKPHRATVLLLLALGAQLAAAAPASAGSVVLEPAKDNTLYEDVAGSLSNGAGDHLFAGRNGLGQVVRGLLEFDVAGNVPAGATITSATLTLFMSRTNNPVVETVSLRRASNEWGEGASDAPMGEGGGTLALAGDATWIHTFFNTGFWLAAGGDFSPASSASAGVGAIGSYSWTSPQLVADVQDFLDQPADDHGWVVIGNEAALAKRFDSRTNPVPSQRPQLTIEFTEAPPVPALGAEGIALLAALLLAASVWRLRRAGVGARRGA